VARTLEPGEQRIAWGIALGAQGPYNGAIRPFQALIHLLQPTPTGKETERPPTTDLQQAFNLSRYCGVVAIGVAIVIRRQRWLIEQRLLRIIKDCRQHFFFAGFDQSAPLFEMFKMAVGRQGGAGADYSARRRLFLLFRVEEVLRQ